VSDLVRLGFETRGDVVVARIAGELDLAGAPQAGRAIEQAVPPSSRALVVDCSPLEFIDSSGVAMLFALARGLASRRVELSVVASEGGPVARVLDVVEFRRAAPVHADLEQALAAFETGAA
jgi:anti-sigma B factor antagonist